MTLALAGAPQEAFAAAEAAFAKGRFAQAAALFETAAAQSGNAKQYVNAGLAWLRAKRPDRAMASYSAAVESGKLPRRLSDQLDERMKGLRGEIAELELEFESGCSVSIDGERESSARRVWVLPGAHRVVSQCDGAQVRRDAVTLVGGEVRSWVVKRPSTEPSSAPKDEPPAAPPLMVTPVVEAPKDIVAPALLAAPIVEKQARGSRTGWFVASGLLGAGALGSGIASGLLWLRAGQIHRDWSLRNPYDPTLAALSQQGLFAQGAHHVALVTAVALGIAAGVVLLLGVLGGGDGS